jgi:predicted ester cyclase
MIDRTFGDAGARRDVVDGRFREAAYGKQLARGVLDATHGSRAPFGLAYHSADPALDEQTAGLYLQTSGLFVERSVTRDEIMKIYRTHVEAELAHDSAKAASTYLPDGTYRHMPTGLFFRGRDQVKLQYAASYVNFPDQTFDIEGEVIEGDTLVHWATLHATAKGPFLGLPPTGKRIALPFVARIEFRDGAMAGETLWYDMLSLCEQAGYAPEAVRKASEAARARFAA